MRKLVAFASIGLSIGFAFALANAEDTTKSKETSVESSVTDSHQQAGTADPSTVHQGQPGTVEKSGSVDKSEPSVKSSRTTEIKSSNTCTDESGVTHQKNEKGYKECVEKTKRSDQMSGQASPQSKSEPSVKGDTTRDTSRDSSKQNPESRPSSMD